MSIATPTTQVPDTRIPVPTWVRHHLSWMLVGLAVLAAAAVLAVTLIGADDGARTTPLEPNSLIERGSISAIEHRTSAPAAASMADRGSITAIDRRTATQGG